MTANGQIVHRKLRQPWESGFWLTVCVFFLCAPTFAQSVYINAFKSEMTNIPVGFSLKYVEGDIESQPSVDISTNLTDQGQKLIFVKPSVYSYAALYQTNGFKLERSYEAVLSASTNALVARLNSQQFGCGRVGDQAWDSYSGVVSYLDCRDSSSPTAKATWEKAVSSEDKIWSIYHFGIPPFDVRTISWSSDGFSADTSGGKITAKWQLNNSDGKIDSIAYTVVGNRPESGFIFYKYSQGGSKAPIPNVIERRVTSGGTPLYGAMQSYKIKILSRIANDTILDTDRILSPIYKSPGIISNGQMLVSKIVNNKVSYVPGNTNVVARMQQGNAKRAGMVTFLLFFVFTLPIILLVRALMSKPKNKPTT